jgi:hypothetical protein
LLNVHAIIELLLTTKNYHGYLPTTYNNNQQPHRPQMPMLVAANLRKKTTKLVAVKLRRRIWLISRERPHIRVLRVCHRIFRI